METIRHNTTDNNDVVYTFRYDEFGNIENIKVGNRTLATYEYGIKNGTLNSTTYGTNELVASHSYDGWGNCTVNNPTSSNIGDLNPFRYRSYYYDTETGYYYLNSRYYDSSVGRFINSDEISNLGVNNDVQSLNVYAYCANNPIHRYDLEGNFWGTTIITTTVFGALFGFGSQLIINVMLEDREWYQDLVGATIGGAVSGFAGGLGGIMISNAVSISINYIEANICGRSYSDKDVALKLLDNMLLEVGVGMVTGTIIDADSNKLSLDKPETSRFDDMVKYDGKDLAVENLAKVGSIYAATVIDTGLKKHLEYMFNQRKQERFHDYFFGE